jgi:hypothetical protein
LGNKYDGDLWEDRNVVFEQPGNRKENMSILEIGCCGAYCRTCKEFRNDRCQGCKIGYKDGSRDIRKAKCKMKICCIGKNLDSCADCGSYITCETIQDFYNKKSYKYKKYEEATLFIREKGYSNFLKIADRWNNQYGKYK